MQTRTAKLPVPPTLDQKVRCLADPATYSPMPTAVEALETHMSWVFLNRERVFKLKKPIKHDFLDLSTLA